MPGNAITPGPLGMLAHEISDEDAKSASTNGIERRILDMIVFYELNSGQPVVAPPEAIRQGIFLRRDNILQDFCNSASN